MKYTGTLTFSIFYQTQWKFSNTWSAKADNIPGLVVFGTGNLVQEQAANDSDNNATISLFPFFLANTNNYIYSLIKKYIRVIKIRGRI